MDEAWTGLDAGTRATLDTVVTERVAEGATVIFVDHDPARLADQASLQWSLIDGRLHEGSVAGEAGVTCLLIGSAIGALCNPPLIRHRGYAMMATAAVAIAAIAASGSPANAAIRATSAGHSGDVHLPVVAVAVAVVLAALAWAASIWTAPRRAS
jgi:energy-coupling factor transporter ATP-binding protein EcfA2